MSYFLKDIIAIYPLNTYLIFPDLSKYLLPDRIVTLSSSGFYNKEEIIAKIERKYKYNEIATSDVSQFYDMINQLIDENMSEYLMNLYTISESYSVQNIDTEDISVSHIVETDGTTLSIVNSTPGNKLNINNIKAGTSASNVQYDVDKGSNYTDTTHREETSPLNTTQSNVKAQIEINLQVQSALNKFIDNLATAFSIVQEEYYGEEY